MLLVAVVAGAVWLKRGRARRPDPALRGARVTFEHPSRALVVGVPAWFGPARAASGRGGVAVLAGSLDGDAFFLAVVEAVSVETPFGSGAFPNSGDATDGYLRCLQIALPGESSSWWKLDRADDVTLPVIPAEAESPPRTMSVIAARNAVPLVSRVCIAAANKERDLNVRVYARLSAEAWAMYAEDVVRAIAELRVDGERARAVVGQ